ncbi:MAG: protein translocase subunit SecD [Thermoanaerobaculum sp.]|nr:protein translocase subunit SecD [Thermoanaerobaculum sp.]MDW7968719.1 protein translocase subunit SecD [Thermoanaerobaculum sp.]
MRKNLTWRWVLIGLVTAGAVFVMWPPQEKIHLGLDLKGGIHLVLQVNTDDAVRAEVDAAMERLRQALAEKGFPPESMARTEDQEGFTFKPAVQTDSAVLDKVLEEKLPEFSVSRGVTITCRLQDMVVRELRDMAVRQALETIRNRVDQFGVAEPVIQRQGNGDRIVVQLPGVDDPARVKDLIRATAFLEIKPVVATADSEQELLAPYGGRVPDDAMVLTGDVRDVTDRIVGKRYYLVKKASVVTGRDLRNARRSQDQFGQPAVSFSLTPEGGKKFGAYTGAHIGEQMAIVLDNKVYSAPVIRAQITDAGIIEGSFTIQSAEDLALVLRAGALPASITYLEERTVGPSLGRDSIVRGVRSGLAGLAMVVVFMLAYYRGAGINANVALILNAVLLLGALAAFRATLTLPGIAGIILTVGMAVDANVLIFERIREELGLGKTVRNAVDLGFSRALATIIDSNLTTLIAALFLFQFGTGPIRGFAVTLSFGIIISMFTAVFVSRTLFELVLTRKSGKGPQTLSI